MALNVGGSTLGDFFGAAAEDFLVDDPRSAFYAFAPDLAGSPNLRRGFADLFPMAQDEFRGGQARQLLEGTLPTGTFSDFLRNDFPFLERYLRRSPRARGDISPRLSPRTVFNFA
jgi:hypothetical protein